MAENIESETKISDLNTDCLIKVFRYFKNSRSDLYNLKLAYDAFGDAVAYIVQISEFDFVITNQKEEISEDEFFFKKFIEFFGGEMKCLNIRFADEWGKSAESNRIEFLIENYCANGNIKHCKFYGYKLRKSFFENNISLFNSLESLKLEYSTEPNDIDWLMEFIAASKNMKKFYLTCHGKCEIINKCDIFHRIASSTLETCFLNLQLASDFTSKTSNLPMNSTLKELDLVWGHYDPAILTHFPNIECVKIYRHSNYSLDPILTLSALKMLELTWFNHDTKILLFLAKLADHNNMESLNVFQFDRYAVSSQTGAEAEVQLANILSKMTNLKKFKLTTHFQFEHLSQIGIYLKNLREFSFYSYKYYGNEEQKKITQNLLDFIKTAKKLTTVKCSVFGELDASELCETLINIRKAQENTEILYIGGISHSNWPVLSDEQRKYINFVEMKYDVNGSGFSYSCHLL